MPVPTILQLQPPPSPRKAISKDSPHVTQVLPVFDDVYSAGQPTEAELAALAQRGARTIINLRHPSEAAEFADLLSAS